jgi:hypothetical protein
MSGASTVYGAFNARWLTPEEVAESFVPVPQFAKVVQNRHSLLMGPRGCGKTTLLKMLTRPAQMVLESKEANLSSIERPEFEAIYVPADIKWSFELASLEQLSSFPSELIERSQRVLVALAGVLEALRTFEAMLTGNTNLACDLSQDLLKAWDIARTPPRLSDVGTGIRRISLRIRRAVVERDQEALARVLGDVPDTLATSATDAIGIACDIFEGTLPHLRPRRWAICFDELEIAPRWLQRELLSQLRSTDQRFLFKLTWTPVLPQYLRELAQPQADFDDVRLWHSHVMDARAFCRRLATRLIKARLGRDLSPEEVFGKSLFAAEDRLDSSDSTYDRGSDIWQAMIELAYRDRSFHLFLMQRGFNPEDPVSDSTKERDECLRKIKPLVLLRETFKGSERARSRKRVAIYSGEDAIYAMSDGNPRWLSGLLNELLTEVSQPSAESSVENGEPPLLRISRQAQILSAASRRMMAYVKAFPSTLEPGKASSSQALPSLIERIAAYFRREILERDFSLDPVGSFIVDSELLCDEVAEVERGLLLGALLSVGGSELDVPDAIEESRVRLSFMFSPLYRLPLRNYRAISLSSILRVVDDRQPSLFDWSNADELNET